LGANIHHVSKHRWKGFSRSRIKSRDHSETKYSLAAEASFQRRGVEAYLL